MADRLKGKRALVTAAGQGIGRATALAFAREGAEVTAVDLNPETLASLQSELPGVTTHALDLCDPASAAELAKNGAPFDVLFNCVGYVHNGTILDCDEEGWSRSLDINVTSMYRLIRALLPAMLEQGRGSIVNVSSVASSVTGVPNRFAYGATKAAVIGLTKAIAADFVAKGIRANAICPGTVDSPSLQQRMQAQGDYEAARAAFIARQPMGRLGTPEEVAHLALYLASDESNFTTGAIHLIDGGWCV